MTLQALRQALSDPAIYPEPTSTVEIHETHISLVFLTDQYAYKIKKPVDLGFVDYSTLETRRALCAQEVTLNRRLSTDVYLDVVALYQDGPHYSFADTGPVVEYAVKMRRLPAQATLGELLQRGTAPDSLMIDLARRLAAFHATHAIPEGSDSYGTHEAVLADWRQNFAQTTDCIGRILPSETYTHIEQAVMAFLNQRQSWFDQRVADGRIRDCHGDLRAEHIYLDHHQLQIIDCIEFNPQFRYIDVVSEMAFLAMDLERLGFPEAARAFVRAYGEACGDSTLYRLLDFYRCYRAYVRGKVRGFLLQAASPRLDIDRLQRDAEHCFALAARYAGRLQRPLLIMTTGLIGTGKSTIAEGVAAALALRLLNSDRIRKERAGLAPETPQRVAYGAGLYSAATSAQTYETLAGLARTALQQGESVMVDAAFSKQAQRELIQAVAVEVGAECYVLECLAPETVIRERLDHRGRQPGAVSDGRWAIFPQFQQNYEPVQEMEGACHIRLDATQLIEPCTAQALAGIQEGRAEYDRN